MFKLVVLSALFAVAACGVIDHHVVAHHTPAVAYKSYVDTESHIVETPTVQHVGDIVKSYPSATSYQSQTQYHSKNIVEPVYAHGVEKHVISTPITKQVVEQVAVPVTKTVVAAPAVHAYHAPAAVHAYSAPAVHAYHAPAAVHSYSAPVVSAYSAHAHPWSYAPSAYAYNHW